MAAVANPRPSPFFFLHATRCLLSMLARLLVAGPPMFTPEARNLFVAVPLWRAYVLFQLLFLIVDSVIPLLGFVLLFTRNRWAPAFFKAYLAFMIFGGLFTSRYFRSCTRTLKRHFERQVIRWHRWRRARAQAFLNGLRAAAFGSIWLLYWVRSTRVQRLFAVSNAEQIPGSVGAHG